MDPFTFLDGQLNEIFLSYLDLTTLFRMRRVSRQWRRLAEQQILRIINPNDNHYNTDTIFHHENIQGRWHIWQAPAEAVVESDNNNGISNFAINLSFTVPLLYGNTTRNGRHMTMLLLVFGDHKMHIDVNAWNQQHGALNFGGAGIDIYSDVPEHPRVLPIGRGYNDGNQHEIVIIVQNSIVYMFVDNHLKHVAETVSDDAMELSDDDTPMFDNLSRVEIGCRIDVPERTFLERFSENIIHSVSVRRIQSRN